MSNTGSGDPLQDVVDRLQGEIGELRRSRKRLVEAADADRRAIERALHDGVQQHLVALAVDLQRVVGLVDGDPAAAKALLDEMAANLREALTETTDLAQKIYPPLLEGRGFATALRSAAESAGVTVLVDVPAHAGFPPEISAAVYWSCVEALLSASPGSQATVNVRDAGDSPMPKPSSRTLVSETGPRAIAFSVLSPHVWTVARPEITAVLPRRPVA